VNMLSGGIVLITALKVKEVCFSKNMVPIYHTS
jgi:hypothetical protein